MENALRAQHYAVWTAIDDMAAVYGLSPTALAKLAGMDGTVFNPSKRMIDGVLRWPSTSTIAAVLIATGSSWAAFAAHVEAITATASPPPPPPRPKRLIPFAGKESAADPGL